MNYKVSLGTNSYSVKQKLSPNFKVSAISGAGASTVANLSDLSDVDVSGIQDNYVIMYDSASGKYKAVNPDVVLSKAATEPISPGLPADFEAQLDVDLDNKINLDGGGF